MWLDYPVDGALDERQRRCRKHLDPHDRTNGWWGAIVVFRGAFAIVGLGLWSLKEWRRAAAIVLAILQLLLFPCGTTTGALTLLYLLSNPDAKATFQVA